MKLRKVSLRNHAFTVHFQMTPNRTLGIRKLTLILIISLLNIGMPGAQEIIIDKVNNSERTLGIVELYAPDLTPSGVSILTDILLEETMSVVDLRLYPKVITLKVMDSFELYISGFAGDSTSSELKTILALDYVLSGKIGLLGNTFLVTLNLYNVSERSLENIVKRQYSGPVETLGPIIQNLVREIILGKVTPLDEEAVVEELTKPVISDLEIKDNEYPLPGELQRTNAHKNLALFGTAYAVWVVNATLSMFDIEKERPYIGGTLVAAPIGFFTALSLSKNTHFSVGRTRMITSTVVWATYWGITSMAVINPEDTSPYLAFSLATGGIGLYGSVKYTSTHEISTSRVNFINIGAFLGSLFGLGVPYLADAQGDGTYMALMTLGGIAGGYTAFKVSKDDSDYLSYNNNSSFTPTVGDFGMNPDLSILPKISFNRKSDEKKYSDSKNLLIGLDIALMF